MCEDGGDHVADRRWTVCQDDSGMTGDGKCVRTVEIM